MFPIHLRHANCHQYHFFMKFFFQLTSAKQSYLSIHIQILQARAQLNCYSTSGPDQNNLQTEKKQSLFVVCQQRTERRGHCKNEQKNIRENYFQIKIVQNEFVMKTARGDFGLGRWHNIAYKNNNGQKKSGCRSK